MVELAQVLTFDASASSRFPVPGSRWAVVEGIERPELGAVLALLGGITGPWSSARPELGGMLAALDVAQVLDDDRRFLGRDHRGRS